MIIGIDFDGTTVTHEFPRIGKPIPHAIEVMLELLAEGHHLILFTMRSGLTLKAAVDYMEKKGVKLFGVNTNPTQTTWTTSPKAYCDLYIDDAALGCPLEYPEGQGRLQVDWLKVRKLLKDRKIL